jgi:hypothetical protein
MSDLSGSLIGVRDRKVNCISSFFLSLHSLADCNCNCQLMIPVPFKVPLSSACRPLILLLNLLLFQF